MKKMRLLLLLPILFWIAVQFLNYRSHPAAMLGATDGMLAECPASPNAVCSQSESDQHAIPPFSYAPNTPATAWPALRKAVGDIPRVTIVEETDVYLRGECRTLLMRYVDDIEFLHVPVESLIHIRSASRIGYSDLDANRKRMEQVRLALQRQIDEEAN